MNILIEKFKRNKIINGRLSKGLVSLHKISLIFDFRRLFRTTFCYQLSISPTSYEQQLHAKITKAQSLGMVDNFEYGNFENLTSRLRHQTGLCVGNLAPHFQHIVTVGQCSWQG